MNLSSLDTIRVMTYATPLFSQKLSSILNTVTFPETDTEDRSHFLPPSRPPFPQRASDLLKSLLYLCLSVLPSVDLRRLSRARKRQICVRTRKSAPPAAEERVPFSLSRNLFSLRGGETKPGCACLYSAVSHNPILTFPPDTSGLFNLHKWR